MYRAMRKSVFGCPTRSDTNLAVQPQKMVRGFKFQIKEEEGFYYLCSENKGADQLCGDSIFVFAYAKAGFLMTWPIL